MAFSKEQLNVLGDILEDAANADVMPHFGCLERGDIQQKTSAIDLVTVADEAAERRITKALDERFPGALIIGEEAVAQGETSLDQLMSAELSFVVDPIDGTRNYASNTPLFAVMAAAIEHGEVTGAVILDPLTKRRLCALRGRGAWCEQPGQPARPLRVAPVVELSDVEILVSTGSLDGDLARQVFSRLDQFGAVSMLLCSAHEYRLLAEGFRHASFYHGLMPWDHAPGWLIHQEAGGYAAHFDGSPYRLDNTEGGLICATDEASWHHIREALLTP